MCGHLLALDTRDLLLHPAVWADDVLNRLKMAHPGRQREGSADGRDTLGGNQGCHLSAGAAERAGLADGRELIMPLRGIDCGSGGRGGMERARKSLRSVWPGISASRRRSIQCCNLPAPGHTYHFFPRLDLADTLDRTLQHKRKGGQC